MKKLLMVGLIVTAVNANHNSYHSCIIWESKHYRMYWDCQSKYPEEYALSLKADGLESLAQKFALQCRIGNISHCDKVDELIKEANEIRRKLKK